MTREKLRALLVKLFALMGSDNANESQATRDKIRDLLGQHRMSWNDGLELIQQAGTPAPNDAAAEQTVDEPPSDVRDIPPPELIVYLLQQYVDLAEHEYVAVALWILHAHVYDKFKCSPRLALTSPVHGCGKTTLLEFIERLLSRPKRTDSITPAAIYRLVPCDAL